MTVYKVCEMILILIALVCVLALYSGWWCYGHKYPDTFLCFPLLHIGDI